MCRELLKSREHHCSGVKNGEILLSLSKVGMTPEEGGLEGTAGVGSGVGACVRGYTGSHAQGWKGIHQSVTGASITGRMGGDGSWGYV